MKTKKNDFEKFIFGYENPINKYEECPLVALVVIGGLIIYGIWGIIVVFS